MLKIYIFSFLLYISVIYATDYPNDLYKDLWQCDEFEPCKSFVDYHLIKVTNRLRDTENVVCDWFNDYALGYFFTKPPNSNLFDEIADAFDYEVIEFLNKPFKSDESKLDLKELLSKMKTFYDRCKEKNSKELTSYLDKMPKKLLNSLNWKKIVNELEWQEDRNWIHYIADLRTYGLNDLLIRENIVIAYNDSTRYVIELQNPRIEATFMINPQLKSLKYNDEQLIEKVYDLQKAINDLSSKYRVIGSSQDDHKQLITLNELKEKIPNIDWKAYFNILLSIDSNVNETLPIQISHLNYFKDLVTLLDQTDKKTIAFYILQRLIDFCNDLSQSCEKHLWQQFPIGTSYIFDRFIYKTHQKDFEELQRIFFELKKGFSKKISENKFHLNPKEQNYLQEKINGMTLKLGYLPENESSSYYNSYYNDVNLINSDFIDNRWEMLQFNVAREHAKVLENHDYIKSKINFESDDQFKDRAKPYFIKSQNKLIIPFEFMRAPLFSHGENILFRHSLTAFALAREMMIAFGPNLILFDSNGNEDEIGKGILQKTEYQDNLKCLRKNENSKFDEERFADVAGLQLIIDTFFYELPTIGKDSNITIELDRNDEKVSFDVRELFFLHFAQYFAGFLQFTTTPFHSNEIEKQNFDDRLNMIVSNVPEFSEVFNCSTNSRLNLETPKCIVW